MPSLDVSLRGEAEALEIVDALGGHHFIDGVPVGPACGRSFTTVNPYTAERLADLAFGTAGDVDLAVESAERAFLARWRHLDPHVRGEHLRRVAQAIRARAHHLAWLDTLDAGRPVRDALERDVERAAQTFEFFAGLPVVLRGASIPVGQRFFNYTRREPYGVVAAITPWNYPLTNAAIKIAPALACGNTVVLKPAEQASLSALLLARVCADAGLPDGVVNVVTGLGPDAGAPLVQHPAVHKIAFTGSTQVGKALLGAAASSLKSVTLELGGKSPNIIFADAPLEEAAHAALFSAFMHQGQTCTAGTRLLLDAAIAEQVVERIRQLARKLRIGDPRDPSVQIGPVISAEQLERIRGYVAAGTEAGATIALGPADLMSDLPGSGYFFAPHLLVDVTPEMRIAQEEIFGPVLSVLTFRDEEEAIALANGVAYGLAGSIWTSDLRRAHRLAERLEAGLVWVNTIHALAPGSPYGGYKESGMGVEMGLEAAEQFTRLKSVWIGVEPYTSPWQS
jgi:acyl-CoA reductase-like NAD-dependent aldehyde dehydrogenase